MISVVIPLYNKEKSITNTVRSVLEQTYKDFELIIVNDGSTDNSLDVVKTIIDDRIRIIDKPNGGVSSARNRGIEESSFEYIAFLDGDDLWSRSHLEIIVGLIQKYINISEVGGYGTSFIKIYKGQLPQFSSDGKDYIVNDYFQKQASTMGLFNSSSFAIKKDIVVEVGLFDESLVYGEDVEFWYRIFKAYKLVMNDSITSAYFIEAENRSAHRIIPLNKRFHKFNYTQASKEERKYLDKLLALLLLDYFMQKAYKIFFEVSKLYIYRLPFTLPYYVKLLLKKMRR